MTAQRSTVATGRTIILQPGEGRLLPGPGGITLKATGDETAGSLGFIEATSPPGFGPPRHIHHKHDELFYVLAGEFRFLVDEEIVDASPGTFVFVPRGTVHTLKVIGDEPGARVVAFVPGGAERVFEELARLAASHGGPAATNYEQMRAVAAKYDSEFVGPPLY